MVTNPQSSRNKQATNIFPSAFVNPIRDSGFSLDVKKTPQGNTPIFKKFEDFNMLHLFALGATLYAAIKYISPKVDGVIKNEK